MKRRKDRWVGVSPEAKRRFIKARHKLTFEEWCVVVQARINMTRERMNKKVKNVPKALKHLPVTPNQSITKKHVGIKERIQKMINWFYELFTPAKSFG